MLKGSRLTSHSRVRMYLVDVVIARVVQVMADAGSQQDQCLQVSNLTGQFHTPYHGVHLQHA